MKFIWKICHLLWIRLWNEAIIHIKKDGTKIYPIIKKVSGYMRFIYSLNDHPSRTKTHYNRSFSYLQIPSICNFASLAQHKHSLNSNSHESSNILLASLNYIYSSNQRFQVNIHGMVVEEFVYLNCPLNVNSRFNSYLYIFDSSHIIFKSFSTSLT